MATFRQRLGKIGRLLIPTSGHTGRDIGITKIESDILCPTNLHFNMFKMETFSTFNQSSGQKFKLLTENLVSYLVAQTQLKVVWDREA